MATSSTALRALKIQNLPIKTFIVPLKEVLGFGKRELRILRVLGDRGQAADRLNQSNKYTSVENI